MSAGRIMLELLSPEKTIFRGEVRLVHLPGSVAPFTVLYNHAPLLAALTVGAVRWESDNGPGEFVVSGGFVEIKNNCVTVCTEFEE